MPTSNTAPNFNTNARSGIASEFGASSIALRGDGKIVLVTGDSVVMLHTDGSLDTSFGGGTKAILGVSGGFVDAISLVLQPDGKLLLGGSYGYYGNNTTTHDYIVFRLNADGSLDNSFSGDGKAVIDMGGRDDYANSMVVQQDGKVVLAGESISKYEGYNTSQYSIVRLNIDGSLDSDFRGYGKLLIDIYSDDWATSMVVQPDWKIVLGGNSWTSTSDVDFSIVRLNVDASMDTSFGEEGKAVIDISGSHDQATSLVMQPDGKLVLGGYSNSGTYDYTAVRLNADGSLDTSFGEGGKAVIDVGNEEDHDKAYSMVLQPDGKLVLGGSSYRGITGDDYSVVRLNADGSLDRSFSEDGKLLIDMGSTTDQVNSLLVQPNGKVVLAGNEGVVRLNADGSLDTTFGAVATGGSPVNTLGGSVAYTENAPPVILDSSVQITDAELSALNSGAGNYAGASITLARQGGANAQDVFSGSGSLSFSGGNAVLSGTTVGTVSQANGNLTITFNSAATQAKVNQTLSSIAYSNTSDAPPASVQIDWTFSDGNTSDALSASGTTTVNVTAVNDAPTGTATITGTAQKGQTLTAANTLADADGLGTISYQWYANGETIDRANGDSLTLEQAHVGKAISVQASYTDGGGAQESIGSAATEPVANLNAAPLGNVTVGSTAQPVALVYNGHQYMMLPQVTSWADAETAAVALGSHLVTIDNAAENQWLYNTFSSTDRNLWTGLNDAEQEGTWVWADGSPVDYTNWNAGEPNNAWGIEDYGHIIALGDGSWNDLPGSWWDELPVFYKNIFGLIERLHTTPAKLSAAPLQGQTLHANTVIYDGDGINANTLNSVTYQWYADGQAIDGANGDSLTLELTHVGKAISVQASYTDGLGTAESVTSGATATVSAWTTPQAGTDGPDTLTGTVGADTLNGLGGDDSLDGGIGTDTASYADATTPVSVILYGNQAFGLSSGNDTLTAIENILGSAHSDLIYGDAADNVLDGGAGHDTLDGADGNDTLLGQTGDDLLNGLAGNDSQDGGEGNDSLYGWADNDTLVGGVGTDHLFGGAGADSLEGGADADQIEGDDGNDTIAGSAGDDTLRGWNDDDSLDGGDGDNALFGGAGADSMQAGSGADQLEGDDGNDTIAGGSGNDTLRGWNDDDSLDGEDGDDALFGGAGADVMLGGSGADQLEGDDGNDTIAGGVGNDTLRGWNDNDSLIGDDGDDLLVGWSGNDSLVGGQGDDQLFGDDGVDTMVGGDGGDVLQGGLGNDVYVFATGYGFDGVRDYDYTEGNSDTFQFTGINLAELSFAKVGDALKVERTASAGADVIYVNDWYMAGSNGAYKIETWIMGDASVFTAAQIEALV